jgi:hypothetical protein
MVFPAAAPATAPTPPPAQNPPEERNRGGRGDSNDQRKQPN